ncbi:MAG: E3 binding domain-containing protein [Anaerolineaceae bacterium]|nr:E3 binding domain-containing protein [Anaerolineaceae bacterium]
MPTPLWLPRFDPAHEQSRLLRWLVTEGDAVLAGDPLCEVETDKVNMELEAPASGLMGPQRFMEGTTVPVVTAIAWVLSEEEQGQELPDWPRGGDLQSGESSEHVALPEPDVIDVSEWARGETAIAVPRVGQRTRATPAARHLARIQRLDLESLRGSGPRGRVQAADVKQAGLPAGGRQLPVILELQLEMSAIRDLQRMWPAGEIALNHSALLVFACAKALTRHPALNVRRRDGRAVRHDRVDLALIVPYGDKQLEATIEAADRVSLRTLLTTWPALLGGEGPWTRCDSVLWRESFRICDLGDLGLDRVTARPGAAAVACLGAGRVVPRYLESDGDLPEMRPTMALTLTIASGSGAPGEIQGARFLEDLATMLENPLKLLLQGGQDANRDWQ